MSTSATVPAGTTSVLLTSGDVSVFPDLVDDVADQFDQQLDGETPIYLYEWSRFLTKARRTLKKKGTSFKDTSKLLVSNPSSWHDFLEQMEHHHKWTPLEDEKSKVSDQDSIPSSLSKQRREQSQFETSMSDFKSDMEKQKS